MTRIIGTDRVFYLFTAAHMAAEVASFDPFQGHEDLPRHHVPFATGDAAERIETSFALTFGFEDCPAASLDNPSEPELPFAEDE